MNKAAYVHVANQINSILKGYDTATRKPRVQVVDTSMMDKHFDKWSLFINNDMLGLIEDATPRYAADLLYTDNVYTFTEPNGTDYDMYIEPVNGRYFSLAKM